MEENQNDHQHHQQPHADELHELLLESKEHSIVEEEVKINELERILSDTRLTPFQRFRSATVVELKLLFFLAAPVVLAWEVRLKLYVAKLMGPSEKCNETWNGFSIQAFSGLPKFFKLSLASAIMLCLEAWYFQILVLIAGLLKNPELALDSLSICMTISGLVFMISVGFNTAASVRVSNELGAGNAKSAAFSVLVVTFISFIISVIAAIIVLALRHVISYVFTEGENVANAVSELTPFLAIALMLNEIQPVLSGVVVGCGWQAFVAYVNIGCYYVVGVPLGVLLGFTFDLGAKGIWSGMIGGTVMQTVILIWVTFRTD
ncbi:hypothetical protein GIB67_011455 [Kingdonia uniflora]|uniref:Uncharacterized protein n=1 Tax=Kingdonia uniflora TaxID=39325 RepID=A0A7J7NM26_9MAGN|nr:hypothetical protein GIB67_011455 [Kingdonia uniflora]